MNNYKLILPNTRKNRRTTRQPDANAAADWIAGAFVIVFIWIVLMPILAVRAM